MPLRDRLRGSWGVLLKEVTAFGAVGAFCLVLDLGVFNLLLHMDVGVLTAKCISTIVATTVAYLGNRHLSFSHRARTGLARETSYFFAINIVVLLFSELILALFAYPLGFKYDHLVIASAVSPTSAACLASQKTRCRFGHLRMPWCCAIT